VTGGCKPAAARVTGGVRVETHKQPAEPLLRGAAGAGNPAITKYGLKRNVLRVNGAAENVSPASAS